MAELDRFLVSPDELRRFNLKDILGEGADLQAFDAVDRSTGERVVIKRPHPSLISRNIHDEVERRVATQISLRILSPNLVSSPRLITVTELGSFDWFFGDDLRSEYTVHVEERAVGIPLVASVADQIRGHPVGLPMNLFVLHPAEDSTTIVSDPATAVLDVIEACLEFGYVAHDLRPQNVYFSPGSNTTTVIDLGALLNPQPETPRREPVDLNDVLFEFFSQYTTPKPRPTSAKDYAQFEERRFTGPLSSKTEALAGDFERAAPSEVRDQAASILSRITDRGYSDVVEFRHDYQRYVSAVRSLSTQRDETRVWREALKGLEAPYWRKYLFDAEVELARYM